MQGIIYRNFSGLNLLRLEGTDRMRADYHVHSVILGHLGSDAVAANSIANITKNLLVCVCTGFGYGVCITGNING